MKKLANIKLNRQTPCPPRSAVPVNTRMWLEVFHFAHPVRFRSWRRPFQLCGRQNFSNRSGGQGQSVSPDPNFAQNMRTNRFAIMALAVFLFSFLPNLAQAFYNPQTGHWLSRDPIEEKGGINLYESSGNDSIDLGDYCGLAIVTTMTPAHPGANGRVVVEVEKCEIVIDVGHGYTGPDSPLFIGPTHTRCPWAAGFMGCFATQVNEHVTKNHGTVIPGSPNNTPGDSEWQGNVDQNHNRVAFQEKSETMKSGVAGIISDWFARKSACCPSVKVTFIIWGAVPDSQIIKTQSQAIKWPKGFQF